MAKEFILRPKNTLPKEEKCVVISMRLERELLESYDLLAEKSGRSRNEVLILALQYALENVKFSDE